MYYFFYSFNYQLFVFSFLEFAFLSSLKYTGCSGKNKFFHNSLKPLPLSLMAARDLQSSHRNASVHSYWLVIFCTTKSSRVLARERWQTFKNSWKKNSIFNEHSIVCYCYLNCWFLKSLDIQRLLVLIDMRNWCGMEMERNKINTTSAPWQHGYESFRAFKKL